MKKMKYIIFIVCCWMGMQACQKDVGLGADIEIIEDYTLPQEGASNEANERILQMYKDYNTYVLYQFSNKDALWTQSTGVSSSQTYVVKEGDPQYVDEMLDYIEDIWLRFFPADFLKKGGMPYRIFLADSVYWDRSDVSAGWYVCYNYRINGDAVIIAGMNQVTTMTAVTKKSRSLELIEALWDYYSANGLIDVPDAFYEGTDYTTEPEGPLTDERNLEAYRNRGFLPNQWGSEWYQWGSSWGTGWDNAKQNDIDSYMYSALHRTDEEMEQYLKYDLIREKWNVLLDYYKNIYGIDLRAIANAQYK